MIVIVQPFRHRIQLGAGSRVVMSAITALSRHASHYRIKP
jgi:hypothetical protein